MSIIPEGYVLVPIEPTPAMIEAARQLHRTAMDRCFPIKATMDGIYRAAVDAAPQPITDADLYVECP